MCISQGSREKEPAGGIEKEKQVYFKALAHGLWGLASQKSLGWAGRLEIQVRDDTAVLSLKVENEVEFQCCSLEAEFFLWETSILSLKAVN